MCYDKRESDELTPGAEIEAAFLAFSKQAFAEGAVSVKLKQLIA